MPAREVNLNPIRKTAFPQRPADPESPRQSVPDPDLTATQPKEPRQSPQSKGIDAANLRFIWAERGKPESIKRRPQPSRNHY